MLHDIYQHTHAEIAAMLGIEEGTSKSNLSRAHAQLRRFIGGHDD
ncbi:MAG: RNA polymerase sigma factor [Thermoanaerobaculia bacterium]